MNCNPPANLVHTMSFAKPTQICPAPENETATYRISLSLSNGQWMGVRSRAQSSSSLTLYLQVNWRANCACSYARITLVAQLNHTCHEYHISKHFDLDTCPSTHSPPEMIRLLLQFLLRSRFSTAATATSTSSSAPTPTTPTTPTNPAASISLIWRSALLTPRYDLQWRYMQHLKWNCSGPVHTHQMWVKWSLYKPAIENFDKWIHSHEYRIINDSIIFAITCEDSLANHLNSCIMQSKRNSSSKGIRDHQESNPCITSITWKFTILKKLPRNDFVVLFYELVSDIWGLAGVATYSLKSYSSRMWTCSVLTRLHTEFQFDSPTVSSSNELAHHERSQERSCLMAAWTREGTDLTCLHDLEGRIGPHSCFENSPVKLPSSQ